MPTYFAFSRLLSFCFFTQNGNLYLLLFYAGRQVCFWYEHPPRFADNLTPICFRKKFFFSDCVCDYVQGVSWIRDPQRLYPIKSCYYSSSTGFKSVFFSFLDCVFEYFDVALVFNFLRFFVYTRKDTYGVFSEAVDPNEVTSLKNSLMH